MEESGGSSQEKTEEPSGKRIEEFRKEGQIARSPEIAALVVMGGAVTLLVFMGHHMMEGLVQSARGAFQGIAGNEPSHFVSWARLFGWPVVQSLSLFLIGLFVMTLSISLAETGFVFSPKVLQPKLSKINPIEGIRKLFSSTTFIQFAKNCLKVIVIGFISYRVIHDHLQEIVLISSLPLIPSFLWTLKLLGTLFVRSTFFLGVIALLDYGYQRWSLYKKMKMTRQELKDEMKESQLPDHIKSRLKQIQKERAKRVIQKEVPKADVVVTNPTHYAVALKYQRNIDRAPRVVAKGADRLAALIREIATLHDVPLYENPELARGLYRKVRVGRAVPIELYESVARVLAYVYQLHRRRGGQRILRH